jgi:hypothetical protein
LISHGFEDFGLSDPSCPDYPYVWLEYGGKIKSGTMYCCGVTDERTRKQELVVEDIAVPLVVDEQFKKFDDLIQQPPSSIVHATLIGRFFSGKKTHYPAGHYWGGYGHMGCCSLLAIQQVVSVDPHDREDLDYRAAPDQPSINKKGCGYRFLTNLLDYSEPIKAQREAENGVREWSFDEPQRVASDAISRLAKLDMSSIVGMRETRKTQGRFVYEWNPEGKKVSYMVVVSCPYWLSFYAKDASKVAWVVMAAYELSCGKDNAVTRIK